MNRYRILSVIGITLCFFGISFSMLYSYKTEQSRQRENMVVDESTISENTSSQVQKDTVLSQNQHKNFLLCGVDQSSKLTDVILLVSYDQQANQVSLLQIPRDTYVGSSYRTGKINSIYAGKRDSTQGMEELKKMVETMFVLPIDYTAVIDLSFFRKAVDIIGGVSFDVPQYIEYLPGKVLYPGEQVLNGTQAEWLVRYRKGYATGDLGRLEMQKQFLSALGKKAKSLDMTQLTSLAAQLYGDVKTDIPIGDILELLPNVSTVDTADVNIFTLDGYGKMCGDSAVYELDKEKTAVLLNENFRRNGDSISAEELSIPTVPYQPVKAYDRGKEESSSSEESQIDIFEDTPEKNDDIVQESSTHNPWADFVIE